ncbi:MAG: menaquinol oxidoreductase [bacterium]|nr:menaquinol oxidoreductase [bacterium]
MKENREIFPKDPEKTYGLMEIVKGTSPLVEKEPEDTIETSPHLIIRVAISFLILITVVSLVSLFIDAPLEEIANPSKTPNPAKAPWYFLGLQELLHYFPPVIAGILVPAVVVFALFLLPYLDRGKSAKPKDRKLVVFLFTVFVATAVILTLVGVFFRGENWQWVWPWK